MRDTMKLHLLLFWMLEIYSVYASVEKEVRNKIKA